MSGKNIKKLEFVRPLMQFLGILILQIGVQCTSKSCPISNEENKIIITSKSKYSTTHARR